MTLGQQVGDDEVNHGAKTGENRRYGEAGEGGLGFRVHDSNLTPGLKDAKENYGNCFSLLKTPVNTR
jgi:hypothetical protein